MNITLILTKQCNLRCLYCFETHENRSMSEEIALRAVDFVAKHSGTHCGISFFGGEPLLRRDFIEKCVAHAKTYPNKTFQYNMTTNGLLLDEAFLVFARDNNLKIALSHDGLMSKSNRMYPNGRDCLAELNEKLALLLRYQPNAFLMATVAANTVTSAADSVIDLYQKGVRRVNLALDSRPDAGWDEAGLDELGRQLGKIADYVLAEFREGRRVSFNAFDEKIHSITKEKLCHICALGKKKLYIDTDGVIYPCVQFVGEEVYRIGEVCGGLDEAARERIYTRSLQKPAFCQGCALQSRCVNDCACLNFQQSGEMGEVSPIQCAYQRMLIAAADDLARRMLEFDEERFVERYF